MKVRRFFAPDMRQALRLVRQELGSDAVILSNRAVENGIEIVAAVDFDAGALAGTALPAAPADPRRAAGSPTTRSAPPLSIVATSSATPHPETAARPAATPEKPDIIWSQDPALVEMRRELKLLRGMMETQLSGLAWDDFRRRHPQKVELLQRLVRLGLGTPLCQQIAAGIDDSADIEHGWRAALGGLADRIPETDDDIFNHGGLVALVGPTGVGKTTTLAKLAARFALRHGARQVALISTDEYRIGAHEQLRIYGRILNLPVRTAGSADELATALAEFSDRRLILIDTAGMSQRDRAITEQLRVLEGGTRQLKNYLVLSATTHRAGLAEIVEAFGFTRPGGCILTRLDETTQLGGAIDALIQSRLPVAYVCDGQRVPEDIHVARRHNLVSQCAAIARDVSNENGDEMMGFTLGGVPSNAGV